MLIETTSAEEGSAGNGIRLPWWHGAKTSDAGDGGSTWPNISKRQQAETTDFTGTMAGGAVREQDRRDIPREGRDLLRRT